MENLINKNILCRFYFTFKLFLKFAAYLEVIDVDAVCDILDKLTLKQLRLMEEKMCCELNIETSIKNGCINLAKSRYIMGQASVSATQLPLENSNNFSATTVCESSYEDGLIQLRVAENDAPDIVNPLKWFGVLVPQNLHKAQSIFKNSINYVVECANIQSQLNYNMDKINVIKKYRELKGEI